MARQTTFQRAFGLLRFEVTIPEPPSNRPRRGVAGAFGGEFPEIVTNFGDDAILFPLQGSAQGFFAASRARRTPTINRAQRCAAFSGRQSAELSTQQGAMRSFIAYPAQQDSCFTSLLKVCAASFSPSTIVRYGNNWSASSCAVIRARMASAAV
ncbi:MAG: hypothetical protein FD139_3668 [Methylocystaceae bacterium]|nr:MAG: hypothetical protein FD172_3586 [Methylocystaceae bacterium]TXT42356.1 MAG: hypothetical protein FD139_3668 [Methylocystaceae bacterium]